MKEKQLLGMKLQLLAADGSQVDSPIGDNKEEGSDKPTQTEEKTFTQAELDEIVAKRLARETKKIEAEKQKAYEAQLKAELEESEKLAKMSEAERLKAQAEKERKQFETQRAKFEEEMRAFEQEKILNTTMKTLGEKGLPVEFASFIKADSAEEIMDNISVFEKGFKEAVDKAVSERLRGRTPSFGTTSKTKYSLDSIRNMTTDEINRNWDEIKRCMK